MPIMKDEKGLLFWKNEAEPVKVESKVVEEKEEEIVSGEPDKPKRSRKKKIE